MEYEKTYTAIQIRSSKIDDKVVPTLSHGRCEWSNSYVKTTFASEEEAIVWAYAQDEWVDWLIVPKIHFTNNRT